MKNPTSKNRDVIRVKSRTEKSDLVLRVAAEITEDLSRQTERNKITAIELLNPVTRKLVSSLIYPLMSFLKYMTGITGTAKFGADFPREIVRTVRPRTVRKIDQQGGTGARLLENRAEEKE